MKRVCAWCKIEMGEVSGSSPGAVTHGICRDCVGSLVILQQPRSLRSLLDALPAPVVALDQRATIRLANRLAAQLLGKEINDIENTLPGEALECAYAQLPDGCGNTVHCAACTVRRTIMETLETGRSCEDVDAYQPGVDFQGSPVTRYRISTEKLGDMVLLRIADTTSALFRKPFSS